MAALQEYKCPNCGGAIAFDSDIQKMKCPYCDTEYEMETLKAFDETLKKELPDDIDWERPDDNHWTDEELEGMNVYGCKSCGGEIVVDATTAATACPFCDNPVVIMGRFTGTLRPDYIIPFKLDKEAAKQGFYNHLHGKRLLPKVFRDKKHIDEIKGIYVPFWLFDTEAEANIRYKASKVRYSTESDYDVTETSYYSVVRNGTAQFEKVPVDSSVKMDDELMESIEPFDFGDAVDFQTAYLAGYLADKYDVSEESGLERANERIKESVAKEFISTLRDYSDVETEHVSLQLKNGKASYALFPVWLLNTKWQGEQYTFAMNGQTGKFVGDLPMDQTAYKTYFGLSTAVGAALILALAKFLF